MRLRASPDIFPLDQDRKIARGGKRDAKSLVAVGLFTQPMVEMRDPRDDKLSGGRELAQKVQERHGIGAAGHRGDDTRPGIGQVVLADGAPDAIKQHADSQAGMGRMGWRAFPALFNRNEMPGDGFEPSTPRL